ncbi:MAG: hypothetical protein U9Q37_08380 [Euryarchaeota archaeon]|nr:hypothetical protein [Euryarchaeota archaeon]
MDFNVAHEKYSRLIANNPELEDGDVRYMDDFKDVDLENMYVKYFKADKIYFLRIVRRKNNKGSDEEYGFIDILTHEIKLPKDLINLFIFCIINIKLKWLEINIELGDGSLKEIKSVAFTIKNIVYN